MADFDVLLSGRGIEFIPRTAKANDWLRQSGKAKDLAGSNNALIRDPLSARSLGEALFRKGLTWNDTEAAAGRKALLPTPAQFAAQKAQADAIAAAPPLTGVDKFINTGPGCLTVILTPIVVVVLLLLAYCNYSGSPAPAPSPTETVDPNKPIEADLVTQCDLTIKDSLISRDSYDPEFGWKYIGGGTNAEVLRHYDSTNGFGGKVTSIYDCKYDGVKKRIVSLQTASPYGATTIIADPADKPIKQAHHHKHRHHAE